ncbi:MAG: hypothetical protein ABUL44_00450, partial [Flavobacterium sp.]
MKKIALISLFVFAHLIAAAQSLGGFPIFDYLVSAVHPFGCSAAYILGPPDDSTWVNFNDGDVMTGNFGNAWTDTTGNELLLETSYHRANYSVRMILSTGAFSSSHAVNQIDWTQITDTAWTHLFAKCSVGSQTAQRFIIPLDFNQDFGLNSTDTVTGIEITFLFTTGLPDLAGIYIISKPPCITNHLSKDTTLCLGDTLLLEVTTANASYLWQDNSANPTFEVTQPGTYWVKITTNTCSNFDTVSVSYTPPPVPDLGNDTSLCEGALFLLHTHVANAFYLWQDNSIDSTFSVAQPGIYWVKTTVNKCSRSDS